VTLLVLAALLEELIPNGFARATRGKKAGVRLINTPGRSIEVDLWPTTRAFAA
jgi:DNA-binding IscR family transcriptional regulator